jgi:acetyl esterase/lipase
MKLWLALCAAMAGSAAAVSAPWQPAAGVVQIPLWPGTPPDDKPMPAPEHVRFGGGLVAGAPWTAVENISRPTLSVYPAKGRNSGAAVMVFPGGGFQVLAMDLEGTEICDWLTAKGITCLLLKYRVPSEPYDWHCDCRTDNLVTPTRALADAQRAMGLVRWHAKEWQLDPHKLGVIGFSAGGFLAAEISTRYAQRLYAPIDDADNESARPDFAMLGYPGHLVTEAGTLNPNVAVTRDTPPTFLVQAENDKVDKVEQALVYDAALRKAGVAVELHLFAEGGHAFGLRPTAQPITHWPGLAETWLHTIGVLRGN